MYSTWVDNDHKSASTHRIDSSSKKLPNNRIQVYLAFYTGYLKSTLHSIVPSPLAFTNPSNFLNP